MIELVSATRCIGCDKCVDVCPTDVFDAGADGVPRIARQDDCQTCFLCEAYCPVDALFVDPHRRALTDAERAASVDEARLAASRQLGSYRAEIGWGHGRAAGSRTAIGPPMRNEPHDPPGPPLI